MTSDRGISDDTELTLSQNTTPVTPKSPGLNPNANIFQSKTPAPPDSNSVSAGTWEEGLDNNNTTPTTNNEGFGYINGDISIAQTPGVMTYPPTPESPVHISTDYGNMNGVDDNAQVLFSPAQENPPLVTEESPSSSSATESDEVGESQLKAMLKHQLEYYFSRENLANDSYLVSQMDADQYVPIATVANFNQVKRLTADFDLVVRVLRESSNVQVDEKGEKVRPLHKRCIVILREIPEATPLKDVQNLFSGENCPAFISCEFAHNNSWYVTFDSDEDAQRAYQYLREDVRCFLGKPIMARIKAKPLIRTTFIPKNGFKAQQQQQVAPPYNADANAFTSPATQQQGAPPVTPQTPTQQQTQQQTPQQQQYPFSTHMPPSMPYMNGQHQQAYPFFPPSNVTHHVWSGAPYFDPGMILDQVFAANGYTPGTIKLNNTGSGASSAGSGGRHGFQNMRNRNQTKGSHRSNVERRGSFGDRSSVHSERHSSVGSNRGGQRGVDNIHSGGPSRSRGGSEVSSTSSSVTGHSHHSSHHHQHHHHHHHHSSMHMPAAVAAGTTSAGVVSTAQHPTATAVQSQASVSTTAVSHSHQASTVPTTGTSHHHNNNTTPPTNNNNTTQSRHHQLDSGTLATITSTSSTVATATSVSSSSKDQQQRRNQNFRNRRRREDDGAKNTRTNSQPVSAKDAKTMSTESPKFDLEPTSFPPLPGSTNNTTTGDVFENKMSDVVKGTAKPLTRETKPVPVVSPVPPPPQSPVKEAPPAMSPTTPIANVSSIPTPPPTPQKVSKTNVESISKSEQPLPVPTSVATPTPSSSSPPLLNIEDKQPVKLSYAQMAQRAKERADGVNNNNTTATTTNGNKDSNTPTPTSSSSLSTSTTTTTTSSTPPTVSKSQALREQSQSVASKPQTASVHSPVRDGPRKDREDPKEQRPQHHLSGRRAKENREWRESRDKDSSISRSDRVDRSERRRDREAPRAK